MKKIILFITLLFTLVFTESLIQKDRFLIVSGDHFKQNGKAYRFVGCNYWYGGYLALDTLHNGKERLMRELDFLQAHGVSNLRAFFCGEGDDRYPYRISPSAQEKKGRYKQDVLKSFDFFLEQVARRQMKVVLVLNNNWEWSGGFGQYLEWAGKGKTPLPKTSKWDWNKYCQFISKFYTCDDCQKTYRKWITTVLRRQNTLSGRTYLNESAIMAWELANEPRPMTTTAKEIYFNWIKSTSEFIKGIDNNHLVTVGCEGSIGTANDMVLFRRIHALPTIDYATIHIWPQTWNWFTTMQCATDDSTLNKSAKYIQEHQEVMKELKKPLVLEEFGMRRDSSSYSPNASTTKRDAYFQFILNQCNKYKLAGINFWGFAGKEGKAGQQWFWKKGDPYSADPPQEEQGLYGVYESDESTWRIITTFLGD